MISIDRFLSDEQDPKAVEKVIGKLNDLLTTGEEILYLAVQKKPAVNLLPDCIAITNKRIFYCEPGNLGLTMNFKDISWKSVKEVSFKEEFFGSKFICVPQHGENIVTEFIPKVQARKLHQAANQQLEEYKELVRQQKLEENRATASPINLNAQPVVEIPVIEPVAPEPIQIAEVIEEPEDETTLKLRKLKTLYDKHLITQEEYEAKKANILDSL
ncbi:PH domain-containing protein [Pedobacter rhizosphaerae]|uniref:Short C-terminal domain-containing protein n=1 Tax=Pedobacter rhizosphaerae TaxID=390241 RepID=A0A1H9V7V9_9SPHI|nr:PH domain-containing protein [Pedobacter rhizosphaerae]SES17930.1 Short C-terminal domain-containing protein [Pedobacter rhizosphaerae]